MPRSEPTSMTCTMFGWVRPPAALASCTTFSTNTASLRPSPTRPSGRRPWPPAPTSRRPPGGAGLRRQDLQGDDAVEGDLLRLVHGPHPAAAHALEDAVAADGLADEAAADGLLLRVGQEREDRLADL